MCGGYCAAASAKECDCLLLRWTEDTNASRLSSSWPSSFAASSRGMLLQTCIFTLPRTFSASLAKPCGFKQVAFYTVEVLPSSAPVPSPATSSALLSTRRAGNE
eukprot:5628724-Amphidinium_carterae.1